MKNIMLLVLFVLLPTVSFAQENFTVLCEDTCHHIHGIDISHYQGEVFWDNLGDSKHVSYVYIKATEGGDHIDKRYSKNIELAHKNGLRVGSYHFFRPRTDLNKQLNNFLTQCSPQSQELIPMIDIETRSGMMTEEFRDSVAKFIRMVEEAYRQKPLIYTGTNFYNAYCQGLFDGYPIMIAQYNSNEPVLSDGRDINMWQYTAKGRINGISGYVDKSRFLGNHTLKEILFINANDKYMLKENMPIRQAKKEHKSKRSKEFVEQE